MEDSLLNAAACEQQKGENGVSLQGATNGSGCSIGHGLKAAVGPASRTAPDLPSLRAAT